MVADAFRHMWTYVADATQIRRRLWSTVGVKSQKLNWIQLFRSVAVTTATKCMPTARLRRIFLCEQLSARWRRQNKCDFPEVCGKSAMNLELVYDASAAPSGCCRRHDCDVTALYVNQALLICLLFLRQSRSCSTRNLALTDFAIRSTAIR